MRRVIGLLFVITALAGMCGAQQFDVASVRVSGPGSPRGSQGGPGHKDATRFSCGTCSMNLLIQMAWNMKPFQIGGSVATDNDSWDIVANVPAGTTKEDFRVMLQHLLQERLGLRYHVESKMFAASELVVAKSGLRLKEGELPAASNDPEKMLHFPANVSTLGRKSSVSGGYLLTHLIVQLEPMSVIAEALAGLDSPTVDHTGLTGKYSFTLDFTQDLPGATPEGVPPAPDITTAIRKELGLQLLPTKAPFDVLVVESFRKTPTEN
ncbi:MAG TPA: TIGR03435 family protein [Bryobacteraceae bacterium]|nr:TIGR03435 family protein [Bryobacteraceae bacterium]